MKSFSFAMSLVLVVSTSPPGLRAADESASEGAVSAAVVTADGESAEAETQKEMPRYMRLLESWSTSPDELFRPVSFQDLLHPTLRLLIFRPL
jgi:hypothetical protein